MSKKLEYLTSSRTYVGADPELFLIRDGEIIGSEKVIPEEGIDVLGSDHMMYSHPLSEKARALLAYPVGSQGHNMSYQGHMFFANAHPHSVARMVRDGVQVELQYAATNCRASLLNQTRVMFRMLRALLQDHPGVSLSLAPNVVEVSAQELESLSPKSRILGCSPSRNIYGDSPDIPVDPGFKLRSAGGHLHFGLDNWNLEKKELLVAVLDVLLGSTCVLLDRDPRAAERRQVYGRAGEHRLPSHGVEYRVLSNFWLRDPALMSFVAQMGRLGVSIVEGCKVGAYDRTTTDVVRPFLALFDHQRIQRAINENDFSIAKENWEVLKHWIKETLMGEPFPYNLRNFSDAYRGGPRQVLGEESIADFEYMVERGLDHFFPLSGTVDRWCDNEEGHFIGWEQFIAGVRVERLAEQEQALAHA